MATILIVDDLSADREVLGSVLRHRRCRVIEAADGREALAIARAEQKDLLITDMLMPVMGGSEFISRLRLDPSTTGIPVVCHTASYGACEAKALALSVRIAGILTKPADLQEALNVVRRTLSGEEVNGDPVGHGLAPGGVRSRAPSAPH